MADPFLPHERSAIMRRVKGSGNASTEVRLILTLREHGITGWRRGSTLPGRPDLVFQRTKTAVFVHGCFWHGHGCPRGENRPASNRSYWDAKLGQNRLRDGQARRDLASLGWTSVIVWECRLKRRPEVIARRIAARLAAGRRDRP
ncbi:MAG: very short patch repair endonuclease [Vicinamibacteria bacterium]